MVSSAALDPLDQSGDSVLVATATGLVSVGCCGHGDRQPLLDSTELLPWVSPAGDPSGATMPEVFLEYPPAGDMVVVRSDGTAEQRWTLAGVQPGRDMPNVVATDDGGALLWLYDGLGASPDTRAVLYDLRPDGSVDMFAVGNYTYVAAMHASRVLIAIGVVTEGYAIIRLP